MDTDVKDAVPSGGGIAMAQGALTQDGRGRFSATTTLTDKQRAYVSAYLANGGKRKLAAISAGYSETDSSCTWKLMKNPCILQAIREGQAELINGELSAIAMGTLKQIMLDTAAPAAARVSAAKWTLEAAGHGVAAQSLQIRAGIDPTDKPMSEWTLADLEEMVARKESQIVELTTDKARVIEA